MSDGENHHHGKNEIIIVKRHKGDHDGHHGGAWKIAYADFMTAMMAFFLVMWLVNAANEETKASVASYFNPIKLSDSTPAPKGLKQPSQEAEGEQEQEKSKIADDEPEDGSAAASGEDLASTAGEKTNYSDADLFENPYAVLAEIAQQVGQQANVSARGEGGAANSGPATGAAGGEAYRDPFDPDFWSRQIQAAAGAGNGPTVEDSSLPEVETAARQPETAEKSGDGGDPQAGERQLGAADALREQIQKEIGGISGRLAEGLVVSPSEGGLLVTISDQAETPMFGVGSAVPNREMVLAMEKIGKLLEERKGSVLIRGHTDGRPFRGSGGDNWSLSMSRAHAAYYMLVRGGLDEKRIKQVSGFADRRLQVPDDPYDDANRRIEILIEDDRG